MAMLMRSPSMLPTMTCSNCYGEIQVHMMGEHRCRSSQAPSQQSQQYLGRRSNPRQQLPRIDSSLANRPYQQDFVETRSSHAFFGNSPNRKEYFGEQRSPRRREGERQRPRERIPDRIDSAVPTPYNTRPLDSPDFFQGVNKLSLAALQGDPTPTDSSPATPKWHQNGRGLSPSSPARNNNLLPSPRLISPNLQVPTPSSSSPDNFSTSPDNFKPLPATRYEYTPAPRSARVNPSTNNQATRARRPDNETNISPMNKTPLYKTNQYENALVRSPSDTIIKPARANNGLMERAATTNDLRNPYQTRNPMDNRSMMQDRQMTNQHAMSESMSSVDSYVSGSDSTNHTGRSTPMSEISVGSPPRQKYDVESVYDTGELLPAKAWTPPTKTNISQTPIKTSMSPYSALTTSQSAVLPSRKLPWSPSTTTTDNTSRWPPSATNSPSVTSRPRHVCRGCNEPILGKSIKASDGRMTGRWHKTCFVCTTCCQPFDSTEFYVLKDKPFCEFHYHQLNDSLCLSCNKGIEGEYVQDVDRHAKFHLDCLTCTTCHVSVGQEYFELKGEVYCGRHVDAAVRKLEDDGFDRLNNNNNSLRLSGSDYGDDEDMEYERNNNNNNNRNDNTYKAQRRQTRLLTMPKNRY